MKIKPDTVLKCIVYPAAAFAAGAAAAGLYLTQSQQPGRCLVGVLAPTANEKMRQAKEARRKALVLIKTANGQLSLSFQIGQMMSGYVYIDPRERITTAMIQAEELLIQAEELLKQAEKWEREALEESGAVTPPTDSKTDTES